MTTPKPSITLILSLFPGIGLLDRAFEAEFPDACLVRGPDLLWGGDIHHFHPPSATFWGIIGGPPCKSFSFASAISRSRGSKPIHPNLIHEFERCINEAQPAWFVMENVRRAPIPSPPSYTVRSLLLNNRWLGEAQHRLRRFSFGTRTGRTLAIEVALFEHPDWEYAVVGKAGGHLLLAGGKPKSRRVTERMLAAHHRPLARLCELQGLPPTFLDTMPFTKAAKREAIANGVPLPMGRAIARAVRNAMSDPG